MYVSFFYAQDCQIRFLLFIMLYYAHSLTSWPPRQSTLMRLFTHHWRSGRSASVTRWLDYLLILGHLQQWKFAQWHKRLTKVGSNFCHTLNKPSHKLLIYCQNGEISPNLVTLKEPYLPNEVSLKLSWSLAWQNGRLACTAFSWPQFESAIVTILLSR